MPKFLEALRPQVNLIEIDLKIYQTEGARSEAKSLFERDPLVRRIQWLSISLNRQHTWIVTPAWLSG